MIRRTLEQHPDFFQRLFEIIPGLLIWILIFSPLWAGKTIPLFMADFLIVLSIYWLFRSFQTSLSLIIGHHHYSNAMKKDWLAECNNLSQFALLNPESLPVGQFLPKQLVVYPQRMPQFEVIKNSIDSIRAQNYPKELLYVALSVEQRSVDKDPEYYKEMKEKLFAEFSDFGDRFMIFEHPDGIPGEVIGAAANRTWGAKNAVAELEKRGEIISDFLITSPDEDIVFHPEYLAAATYQYLINPSRKQRFYQTAVYTFNNNYWDVPVLIRVLAASLTLPVLASSVMEKSKRETYSCYSLNLEVLRTVDYWDVALGIDDTTFYWKPYFYFKGDWECEVFFVPLSADAIYDPSYINNHKQQYKQYLRWGWGVISFPIGLRGLLIHREVPFFQRILKIWHLFEVFVFWKVLAYLLTVAIPLIFFLNPQLNESVIWYSVPNTVSGIMGLTVILLVPATIFKALLAPPKPAQWSYFRYYLTLLIEAPMNLVTLLTFSFLPFVEASTRMMFGQKSAKSVIWSDKVRKDSA
jgi:hypothetical protein